MISIYYRNYETSVICQIVIQNFNMQFLSTEPTCFTVLILLHSNIYPVAVTFVHSVGY